MSEHQCYEFLAIDRPLTPAQLKDLRRVSSRAEISSTRFWNEYDYGDFRGDPKKLVERYFDAHLYFANWGSRNLILRVPADHVDVEALKPYFAHGLASLKQTREHAIFDIGVDGEDLDGEEDPPPLSELAPIRNELMSGDHRFAYLVWLAGVQFGDLKDTVREPPVPPGLAQLSAPLEAMAEAMYLNVDLIDTAALASAPESDDTEAFHEWTRALPSRAKDAWLLRAAADPDLHLGAEMLRTFRAEARAKKSEPSKKSAARRTVGELRAAAEALTAKRDAQAAAAKKKAVQKAQALRNKELDKLATDLDGAWTELERRIDAREYHEGVSLALDLKDLYEREKTDREFTLRFKAMKKRQLKRPTFYKHWADAQLRGS